MSRLLLTLIALIFALPVAAAQEKKIPWANKFFTGTNETPPPIILKDFGTLPKGTIKTYRFNMTNIYAFPMQVSQPRPTCGCVSIIKYHGKLEPRESGYIDIQVDTSRVDDEKIVRIPVTFTGSNPQNGERFFSDAELEVRLNSRPDIAINPGVVQLGVVAAGEKPSKEVTIFYNGRQKGWAISEFGYKKELFDVTVKQEAARSGVAYRVTATLKANAPSGAFEEQIVLKTNDEKSPALILTVTGSVQAALGVFPGNQVKFGGIAVGKKLEKRVILQAVKPFKIKSVEGDGDGVTVMLAPLDAGKQQVVPITFAPTKLGPVKKILTVKTDTGETVKLTIEGTGIEP
jgi:hypothetical protein